MSALDKYILNTLFQLQQACLEFYQDFNFSRVVSSINTHVNSISSAIYFDVSKDCLYTDSANSVRRRSIQTVLNEMMKTYLGLLAPIQPLLTQEAWSEYIRIASLNEDSVFKVDSKFFILSEKYENETVEKSFNEFLELRDDIFRTVESLKQQKFFKNKLELEILLSVKENTNIFRFLKENSSYLDDLFLVSSVKLVEGDLDYTFRVNDEPVLIRIQHSSKCKCPRCWKYTSEYPDILCEKCDSVVESLN